MITRALLNLSTIQVVLFGSVLSRDKFAREPSNQIARIGDEVLFACKLTSQRSNVQWTRNGFGLGFGRDLLGFSRYSIIGSSAEGDWSLKISDVRLEDEGLYQCQVGGSGSSPPMKSREGNLTVYIEPDPPSVLQGGGSGVLSTGAGEWMELTCVSRNGKPPSTIDWLFMNSSTVQYDVRTRVEQMGRMFTTISTIKIKVGKELDGVVIVCQAQNRMDVTPQTTRISLDVEYPPDVKVVFDEASVREGEDLKISCLARANPSKLDYSWLINRVGIIDIQTGLPLKMSEHIIKSISRDMHGAVVTCEVANKRGRAEDSRRISVLYPPTVSISSRKEVVAENEIASIVCKADSNPPSTINWYKHPDLNKVIHTGENLTLPINRKTEGTYSCTAKPEGLEESRAEVADIIMKRKPQILNRDGSVYAILGETAHIRCTGEMIPNHGSVSWRRKGYRVGTDPDPFEVLDEKFGTEFVSTLVIPAVQQQDFGTYECFVENEIGRDGAIFHLREEGELTLASIIGSILGLIFTLLILAAAAYWRLCGYPNVSLHPWKSKSDESQVANREYTNGKSSVKFGAQCETKNRNGQYDKKEDTVPNVFNDKLKMSDINSENSDRGRHKIETRLEGEGNSNEKCSSGQTFQLVNMSNTRPLQAVDNTVDTRDTRDTKDTVSTSDNMAIRNLKETRFALKASATVPHQDNFPPQAGNSTIGTIDNYGKGSREAKLLNDVYVSSREGKLLNGVYGSSNNQGEDRSALYQHTLNIDEGNTRFTASTQPSPGDKYISEHLVNPNNSGVYNQASKSYKEPFSRKVKLGTGLHEPGPEYKEEAGLDKLGSGTSNSSSNSKVCSKPGTLEANMRTNLQKYKDTMYPGSGLHLNPVSKLSGQHSGGSYKDQMLHQTVYANKHAYQNPVPAEQVIYQTPLVAENEHQTPLHSEIAYQTPLHSEQVAYQTPLHPEQVAYQTPVNFYANSLYVATNTDPHWDFYNKCTWRNERYHQRNSSSQILYNSRSYDHMIADEYIPFSQPRRKPGMGSQGCLESTEYRTSLSGYERDGRVGRGTEKACVKSSGVYDASLERTDNSWDRTNNSNPMYSTTERSKKPRPNSRSQEADFVRPYILKQ